jgi:hypothetical protein
VIYILKVDIPANGGTPTRLRLVGPFEHIRAALARGNLHGNNSWWQVVDLAETAIQVESP